MEKTIMIFFAITLINVVLSTIKSVLTVRSTRSVAALINAVAYGFYAMVVKQMATVDLQTVIIATVICNLIGVYFSMWLLDKTKKDILWKITVIPEIDSLHSMKARLVQNGIGYNEYEISTKYGKRNALDIFSESQKESRKVKEIISVSGKVKFHIMEVGKSL